SQMGHHEKALEYLQWVLERDRLDGFESKVAEDELSISNIHAALGQMEKAREGFWSVYPSIRESGSSHLEWALHFGIGHTYEKENPDSAVFHYERALEFLERSRAAIGGAEIRTGFLSGEKRHLYEEVARYYASCGKDDKRDYWSGCAFNTMEKAKARALLDLIETSVLVESSPEEEALLDSLYRLDAESSDYSEEEQRLKNQYLKLRDERLAKTFKPLGLKGAVAGIGEVRKSLSRGTVLMEYALGDTTSLFWVVDRKGHEIYEIPSRSELRVEVEHLRDALSRPGPGENVLRKAARKLYETLVLPAESRISKAKKLVIVPDGVLFEVPFELLLTKEPEEDEGWENQPYLVRSYATVYAPSSSVYLKLSRTKERKKYSSDLLAFGDPDFSMLERMHGGEGAALSRLPHTRAEVLSVGSRIKDERKGIFLGKEASEAKLKEKLRERSSKIVHLATHGLVNPVDPVSSSIVLCPDSIIGEDGYLHTLEILSLPFDVGLVVASACESARGRVSRGEGVVGLSRAFIAAGARGVVASLWAVSDESTAELMKTFYERMLGKKKPAAEAMKDARLALIDNPRYAHPFYWSAFIVIGTDRSPW
ncbi:MAG: CHAT domain-containing protein, partial [Candidatus Krumholzibacteria bacterium]|nr:CHAT domain-containing protein [Candidatus Krumholzibacteria bacterium]